MESECTLLPVVVSYRLISSLRVIGVLEAWNKRRGGGFGQDDKSYLEALSHICTLVLLQCQLQRRAERVCLHWKACSKPAHKYALQCHLQVTEDVLSRQRGCSDDELQKIKSVNPYLKGDFPLFNR